MNSEEIYSKLNEIKGIVDQYAKADGKIDADAIRVTAVLEFCVYELEKAFRKGQKQVQD